MDRRTLQQSLLELVRRTSAELPDDVADVILRALRREPRNTTGRYAMEVIKKNYEMAREKKGLVFATAGSINDGSRLTGMRLIMAAIQEYGQYG